MGLEIYLRDKDQSIVEAWFNEFLECGDVHISKGDIFDIGADAIISPANSFGYMNDGIDLVYSRHFGWDLQTKLQEKIRNEFHGELPVGTATIVEIEHPEIKYLVSAPTMRIPEDVSNTANAYLAFRAALIEINNFNDGNTGKITSVLCPDLGTLTGNMSPGNCAKQMKYAYDSIINKTVPFPFYLGIAARSHMSFTKRHNSVGEW